MKRGLFLNGIVIMEEMGGEFNGVNFNKMSKEEKRDWAIRFTNTLLESQKKPLETGEGQHERNFDVKPEESQVAPLKQ